MLGGGVNLSTISNVLCVAQTSRRQFPDTINFRFMSTLARQNISQASLSDQAAPLPLIPATQISSNKKYFIAVLADEYEQPKVRLIELLLAVFSVVVYVLACFLLALLFAKQGWRCQGSSDGNVKQ